MNKMHVFFVRHSHSLIPRLAAITLLALVTLAWNSLALCDEIHNAAKSGDLAKVKALLKVNPDLVSSKDNDGVTPLHLAAQNGRKDLVELLLAKKAEVNAKAINGWTPLHYAARDGHKDVVKLLLANKAEVDARNRNGVTPLFMAKSMGHTDVAEFLRQHGGHE